MLRRDDGGLMSQTDREQADKLFEEALEASGARDPRDFYRKSLRALKELNPDGYPGAVDYFNEVLVPSIASGEAEPLRAWREYGRRLAQLSAPGRTVEIDETGRAQPYTDETALDRLVLHIPEGKETRALLVALPTTPSQAQRASYELLVLGKHRLTQ
jgi:hypothetical protein